MRPQMCFSARQRLYALPVRLYPATSADGRGTQPHQKHDQDQPQRTPCTKTPLQPPLESSFKPRRHRAVSQGLRAERAHIPCQSATMSFRISVLVRSMPASLHLRLPLQHPKAFGSVRNAPFLSCIPWVRPQVEDQASAHVHKSDTELPSEATSRTVGQCKSNNSPFDLGFS